MAITKKEKELAAVGISIAAGCKPCTDYHMKAVREAGASDDEIRRAVEDAVALRNAATSTTDFLTETQTTRMPLRHRGIAWPNWSDWEPPSP